MLIKYVSASCTNKNVYKKVNKKDCYQRTDHQQKTDKTERARELGRKTREEIGKGKSNERAKIPDKGEDLRHPRPLFAVQGKRTPMHTYRQQQ